MLDRICVRYVSSGSIFTHSHNWFFLLVAMINVFFHCLSVVQPTRLDFSSDELKDMVKRCNLRMLLQFPSYFAAHVKRARTDPELLQILRDLEGIYLGGMALTEDDLAWCVHKGLPLVVSLPDSFPSPCQI